MYWPHQLCRESNGRLQPSPVLALQRVPPGRICNSVNLALAVPPPILSRPLDLFIVAGQGRNVLSQQQATLLGLSAAPRFNTLRPSLIGRLILLVLSPTAVYILSYLPISPTQPLSSHSTTRRR
ncbi:hypothetical protein CGGC5_v002216 [Colletotrichum fructicola Nara gc5]|uniref:Uncharacterized protein n=1 Tax=Colletotrichum fructicola (strain Nara gc5) TaxID=1213859 RepID=A0A7J6JLA3_COLFN|nr:hypothetical protein CGGC5_v002216 [Colletotrichum fructicola Nara gc5]